MLVKLVEVAQVTDCELQTLKKEFSTQREVVHGSNQLMSFNDLTKWRKSIEKLEIKPSKNQVKTKQFIIQNKQKELVGVIDFRYKLNSVTSLEGGHISYFIKPTSRGQGYGKEALKKIIQFISSDTDMSKVLLTCKANNQFSKKLILSNQGILRNSIFINREQVDHYWIDIKKE